MLLRAQRKRPPAALNLQFDNTIYMQVELVKVDMTTEQGQLRFCQNIFAAVSGIRSG